MLKLILKRFLTAGVIFLLCLVVIYTCAYLFVAINENTPNMKPLMKVLTYVLCAVVSLVFVFIRKMQNKTAYSEYCECLDEAEKSFKNNFLYIMKTKEHIASLIAVNCILVPAELSAGLNAQWNIALVILGAALMFVVHNIVFIAVDVLLWMLAFGLKDKKKSKKLPSNEV